MSELLNLTLAELRKGLDSGDFSSKDLVQASLDAIEKCSDLNAFVSVFPEESLKDAEDADQAIKNKEAKVLTGIPIGLKELILTKGRKTTACSNILKNFVPPYDSTVAQKVDEAGAIRIGKTNMDEFAMGASNENSAFGPVKNPWNKEYVSGGSSGGSAAAVCAGLVPTALGTDTGGSIRQPASLTGIFGMKPTYGRVSRFGIIAFASSLDQIGAFGRNTHDVAEMLKVISGKDPYDSTSVDMAVPDFSANLGKEIKGLKIGMPKEYFIDGLQEEVKEAVEKAIKDLEGLGAEIVEISLPHTKYAISCYYIIAPAEASSNLSRYDGIRYGHRAEAYDDLIDLYSKSRTEGFGTEVKRRILIGTYVLSAGYYDAYYLKAQKVRHLIQKDFHKVFEDQCDLIACPTSPTTAFKIGEKADDPVAMYLNDVFTTPLNLAGLPGLSVPCGFDNNNLPIGFQLIGKPWDEATVLQVGHAYEQNTEWHKKRPAL